MIRKHLYTAITVLLVLLSCTSKSRQQSKEERGGCVYGDREMMDSSSQTIGDILEAQKSHKSIRDRLYAELDSADVYNDKVLYGYWFKPHEAIAVNIFFHKDNTYEFKYYEVDKDNSIIDILKKGKYTNNGEVITLNSDEGWDDYFNGVIYYKYNGTNHYLTDKKGDLYLVKGSD